MLGLLNIPWTSPAPDFLDLPVADDERRTFPRKARHGVIQACRLDHSVAARKQPRVTLELRDLSASGMSAICDIPLSTGEDLAIYFPSADIQPGWDASGRVVRCEPSALGYRVAVEFDMSPAAA